MPEIDPVQSLLAKSPLSQAQRADLWDAYHNASDADDLAGKLQALNIPKPVKAGLWDLKSSEATTSTTTTQPSTEPPPRSWMDTAADVVKGAHKGLAHSFLDAGQAVHLIPGVTQAVDALYGQPGVSDEAFKQARQVSAYENVPQMVGGALETAAEMAVPVTKGVKAIPTTAKAGVKFQEVMRAAKNVPVDVNGPGQVALRIQELAERGGSMPMAVRKFLNRITAPNGAAFTYEEARDFASNISRLSANEFQRLTPVVAREVANLRVTLNRAVADAAAQAGKGKEYAQAMNEYARAMRLRGAVESVVEGAKRSVPYATAAGAGYWLTSKIRSLLSD